MRWKKKLLKDARLYLILDTQVNSYDQLFEIAKQSISAGVDIVQLRDKFGSAKDMMVLAERLLRITKHRVLFVINDRVDMALACQAAGVHLGQGDLPLSLARRILGHQFIIGASCQTVQQARKAEREGADYIGFGSVFKTETKPDREPMDVNLLMKVAKEIQIPVFAIGGLNLGNMSKVLSLGIKRLAVCRAICQAKDIKKTTKAFRMKLDD